jgi:hypothetical protein
MERDSFMDFEGIFKAYGLEKIIVSSLKKPKPFSLKIHKSFVHWSCHSQRDSPYDLYLRTLLKGL